MFNGNYLASWSDHDETRRELYRHSPLDADAYDEFGMLMHHMAHAVKPIIGMMPPDPTSLAPRELLSLGKLGGHMRSLGARKFYALHKLMTMSSADYLDEWFETDVLKATKSASGIIGTFMGPRSPGSAYVLLHHYMGEIDGAFRAWGFQKGGTGGVSDAIAGAATRFGAEIKLEAPVGQRDREERTVRRRGARERRRVPRRRGRVRPRSEAHVPQAGRGTRAAGRFRRRTFAASRREARQAR